MKDLIEVRWHGRGGQGAKTVALLFAEAALATGKFVQAFPEYGPERMGAPVYSFDRISSKPITLHCHVENPKYVVVLDPTLLDTVDVTAGVEDDGVIIVNTPMNAKEMRAKLKWSKGSVYTVDARKIAEETIGKNIPNTPMMGALVKIIKILELEHVLEDTKHKLEIKFRHKPEIIAGNLDSIRRAYNEVKGE